jgi:proline iminopeptidase
VTSDESKRPVMGKSMTRERMATVNGARLWTAVQGSGRPMVLCHGGPGGYDYLGPVANMVDDLCEVIRYDQRGSGRSNVAGPYDVRTFVEDLEGLRQHFGFARWIVGGHSWGAGLALAYAVSFPAHADAIVYISGTGVDPRWHDEYRRNRLAALSPAERNEFERLRSEAAVASWHERGRLDVRIRELARKTDVFDPDCLAAIPAFDEHPTSDEVNHLVGADWDAWISAPQFVRDVHRLPMPALFLHGAADPRPARFVETLAKQLPAGQFAAIPQAGHYPWIEQPERFRALLRGFIERAAPGCGSS